MKLKTLLLTLLLSGFTHATVTPVWEDNGVSKNVAKQLSSVGLMTLANWTKTREFRKYEPEALNSDEDVMQIFDDKFTHLSYAIEIDRMYECGDFIYTPECVNVDFINTKFESLKQQILNTIDSHPDAVFIFKLASSYKNRIGSGTVKTQFFNALETDQKARDSFYKVWGIIADVVKDVPVRNLVFNLMNEPEFESYRGYNPHETWKQWTTIAVDRIRDVSPDRTIIIEGIYKSLFGKGHTKKGGGNGGYNFGQRKYSGPSHLITPIDRKNIVYGFHYYEPYNWTHQDSGYKNKGDKGKPLPSMSRLKSDLSELVDYQKQHQVPVILNEFGVNGACEGNGPLPEDRVTYTSVAYETLVPNGIGITWSNLEDPNSPYKRIEGRCYGKFYKDLIPEEQLFKALRLTK